MKSILLITSFFLLHSAFSQQKISISKEITEPVYTSLGAADGKFYFYETQTDGYIIIHEMDATMKISDKKLKITLPEEKIESSVIFIVENTIYYSVVSELKKIFSMRVWKITLPDLAISDPKIVFSVEAKSYVNFSFYISKTLNTIQLIAHPYDFKANMYHNTKRIHVLLNENLEIICKKEFEYEKPVTQKYGGLGLINVIIKEEKDGSWYNLLYETIGDSKLKLNPTKLSISVFDKDCLESLNIDLPFTENVFLNNVNYKLFQDELVCAGFYGVDNNFQPSGIYRLAYNNETGELLSSYFEPFTDEFLSSLDDSGINLNENGLKDCRYGSASICKNGDVIFYTQQIMYDYYGNIIVLYMDSEGNIQYNKIIRLRQQNIDENLYELYILYFDNFRGYSAAEYNNSIYFFLNDNENNKELSESEKPNVLFLKDAAAFAITVTPDGNISRKQLNAEGDDYFISLGSILKNENNFNIKLIKGKRKVTSYKYCLLQE